MGGYEKVWGYVPFCYIAYGYCRAYCDSLCDHLRYVPWEYIFELSASAAVSEFSEWLQVGIDAYPSS